MIALALDAGNGDIEGVKALSKQAKEPEIAEEELLELVGGGITENSLIGVPKL